MAAVERKYPRMNIKSELVIKSLQRQLSEATMQVAMLEAQVLQMQEDQSVQAGPPEAFGMDTEINL